MPRENNNPAGPVATFTLSDKEFEKVRTLVKAKTGISLGLHKRDLVISRLARRLRALGLTTFGQYVELVSGPEGGGELVNMINQITTNKTDFFREKHHFDFMAETLLPELTAEAEAKGQKRIRAWSAGCSSGEEPYTMAITLAEFLRDKPGWDVKILATDLDTTMLQRASAGEYPARAVEPVPRQALARYFKRQRQGDAVTYKVTPELRQMITFRKFNLMTPQYPLKIQVDFVFCRNVLIYFEATDKLDILRKIHSVMRPGALLFVGHSESLMMAKELFRYVGTTIYRKV